MIGGWLVKVVVGIALLGFAVVELGSPLVARAQADDAAHEVANEASFRLRDDFTDGTLTEACDDGGDEARTSPSSPARSTGRRTRYGVTVDEARPVVPARQVRRDQGLVRRRGLRARPSADSGQNRGHGPHPHRHRQLLRPPAGARGAAPDHDRPPRRSASGTRSSSTGATSRPRSSGRGARRRRCCRRPPLPRPVPSRRRIRKAKADGCDGVVCVDALVGPVGHVPGGRAGRRSRSADDDPGPGHRLAAR